MSDQDPQMYALLTTLIDSTPGETLTCGHLYGTREIDPVPTIRLWSHSTRDFHSRFMDEETAKQLRRELPHCDHHVEKFPGTLADWRVMTEADDE